MLVALYSQPRRASCGLVAGQFLSPGELEYELEFRVSPTPAGKSLDEALERLNASAEVHVNHLHHRCLLAWEFERHLGASTQLP